MLLICLVFVIGLGLGWFLHAFSAMYRELNKKIKRGY